jgi:hypothetical protein
MCNLMIFKVLVPQTYIFVNNVGKGDLKCFCFLNVVTCHSIMKFNGAWCIVIYFIFHFMLVSFLLRCEFSLFFVLLQSLMCCVLLTNVSFKVSIFTSMCLLSTMHMFVCWTSKYMCVVCAFLPKHWASCWHLMFFELCCLESPSKLWIGANLERCRKLNVLHYIKWTQFWIWPYTIHLLFWKFCFVFLFLVGWIKDIEVSFFFTMGRV